MQLYPIAPIKAGEVSKVKVLYVEGLANHDGSESWRSAGDRAVQALTGGDAGRVLSRERHYSGEPTRWVTWKATLGVASWQATSGPRAVIDPEHVSKHLTRKSGDPVFGLARWSEARIVNPKGVRR